MKYVLIGAGSRGMVYGTWAINQNIEISAIAELRTDRRRHAGDILRVPENMRFTSAEEMFNAGKLGDAVIIASQDKDHFGHVMQALDLGYDILLEKPIAPTAKECLLIEEKANRLGRKITVCHVLRYTNFFSKIKQILDSGELGKIVSIKHSENIGNWHMAHSFVRGNWRREDESSCIILAKSCHDLDLLSWYVGERCVKAASFGSLSYFREENAPAGSAARCLECPVAENCRYDVRKTYLPVLGRWPADVVCLEQTEEAMLEALKTSPYGRCVYRCDNDVCDHMSTIFEFENGVTATFTLTAHTNRLHRHMHIMCEDGELIADDGMNTITVNHFTSNGASSYETQTIKVNAGPSGHGGGDNGVIKEFTNSLLGKCDTRSSISLSVESHLMALAAEESRKTGKVVNLDEYRKKVMQ